MHFSPASRPLTEEEIADLKDRHYDSIAEKQRVVDLKLQSEVSGYTDSINGFSSKNVRISRGHQEIPLTWNNWVFFIS